MEETDQSNTNTDDVICKCMRVTENTIRATIARDNLKTIETVTEACEAGGGCHSCHILIQLFIDEHQGKQPIKNQLVNQFGGQVQRKGILSNFLSRFKSSPT